VKIYSHRRAACIGRNHPERNFKKLFNSSLIQTRNISGILGSQRKLEFSNCSLKVEAGGQLHLTILELFLKACRLLFYKQVAQNDSDFYAILHCRLNFLSQDFN